MSEPVNRDVESSDSEDKEFQNMYSGRMVKTDADFYAQQAVSMSADFLVGTPPDAAGPMTAQTIDWSGTSLPENGDRYACVLDHVMSPSECAELCRLAEESVAPSARAGKNRDRVWKPALVNVGVGLEIFRSSYRNSDRIIWDHQEVVDRLWKRIADARPDVIEALKTVTFQERSGKAHWDLVGVNKRMRFLRYQGGQFFRPHCDGQYHTVEDDNEYCTHYTLHLYLNDSVAEAGEEAGLVGGATSFLSRDHERKVDVNPKAGRVLIFQHRDLYHSGDEVVKGTKYTMRSDLLYVKRKTEEGGWGRWIGLGR